MNGEKVEHPFGGTKQILFFFRLILQNTFSIILKEILLFEKVKILIAKTL